MDLYPSIRAMYKLDKLWNGRCYYAVIYDENEIDLIYRKFCFDYPTDKVNGMDISEIIPLPALRNMVPTGKISDPTWGIQIKEPMAMKYATSGVSYATFVHEGITSCAIASLTSPTKRIASLYFGKMLSKLLS